MTISINNWNYKQMQYKVDSGLDVVVEAVDTTPFLPSFKKQYLALFTIVTSFF